MALDFDGSLRILGRGCSPDRFYAAYPGGLSVPVYEDKSSTYFAGLTIKFP